MSWLRPPVVTTPDRQWAFDQLPNWAKGASADCGVEGEIVDDGAWLDDKLAMAITNRPAKNAVNGWGFVSEQAENFERFFAPFRKTLAEWSSLWRTGWWPKADPAKRFPTMAKKQLHPFFRKGTPEFARALKVATADERRMWVRFGVAQFKPEDARLAQVKASQEPM